MILATSGRPTLPRQRQLFAKEERQMNLLKERCFRFLMDERGSQVTEFGIYAALVVAGAIVLLSPIGKAVVTAYTQINGAL
jgi:Flp pilus assembly pilin Flp